LILQTINERLMQDNAAAQQEIMDHFKEEMEATLPIAGAMTPKTRLKGRSTQL
jgi:transcriptional activator TraM